MEDQRVTGVCPAILADQCSQGVVVSFVSVTTIQIYVIQPQGCAIIASLTHPGIIVKDVEMDGMVMPFCAPVKLVIATQPDQSRMFAIIRLEIALVRQMLLGSIVVFAGQTVMVLTIVGASFATVNPVVLYNSSAMKQASVNAKIIPLDKDVIHALWGFMAYLHWNAKLATATSLAALTNHVQLQLANAFAKWVLMEDSAHLA